MSKDSPFQAANWVLETHATTLQHACNDTATRIQQRILSIFHSVSYLLPLYHTFLSACCLIPLYPHACTYTTHKNQTKRVMGGGYSYITRFSQGNTHLFRCKGVWGGREGGRGGALCVN